MPALQHAAAAMTVHAGGRRLQCHHCGARQSVPLACPDCASLALQPQGVGTERIEEMLAQRFPDVPVLRIDRGSTRRKDALEQHLGTLGDASRASWSARRCWPRATTCRT